jgi:hypothetical protein
MADFQRSGSVEVVNFPSQDGTMPRANILQIPNPHNSSIGSVTSMEWSSDGYVVAHAGWAMR